MNWGDFWYRYGAQLLGGARVTLRLVSLIYTVGLPAGIVLGVLRARVGRAVALAFTGLSIAVSATPILVLLFWLHYPAQQILGIVVDGFYTASAALAFVMTVMVSDIVSQNLRLFNEDLRQSARVAGMSRWAIGRYVVFPIVTRSTAPSVLIIMAVMLQSTMFAGFISVEEFFRVAQQVNAEVYKPVQVYTLTVVVYLCICFPLHALALRLRRAPVERV